ncbi:PD-(D/E)XK nuclease family protein [Bifidobacterium aquikefiri]|uniref:PD-(D/E)XK nuclease family protein n=1 Tax=Bifidobacterium aquikefiri TaxID=1653207 RepID=UPI0039E794AB
MQEFGRESSYAGSEAMRAVEQLIRGELKNQQGHVTRTLVVSGPPCSGKTEFALEAMLAGLHTFGNEAMVMVVSQRKAAAALSNAIIRRTGVSDQTRPVGTLAALAFRLLSQTRAAQALSLPKLLNGAEQDSLLRKVLTLHIQEVLKGDDCESCRLLARYFGNARTGNAQGDDAQTDNAPWWEVLAPGVAQLSHAAPSIPGMTDIMALINDDFAAELRDMLARMNELGLSITDEQPVLQRLASQPLSFPQRDRLNTQWSLAFHLWQEYAAEIERRYPLEFRLDASRMLVVATHVVRDCGAESIPQCVVIDDWQDLTLAGMSFIQALEARGSRVVLIGNRDESVQSFRGAYPEFLASRIGTESRETDRNASRLALVSESLGRLGAAQCNLAWLPIVARVQKSSEKKYESTTGASTTGASTTGASTTQISTSNVLPEASAQRQSRDQPSQAAHTFLDVVASRVSLSITGEIPSDIPLAKRPGKLPQWDGTLPIAPVRDLGDDGTVNSRIFQSPQAEMDDILWQIRHESLANERDWNDMAIIAHDNSTIRAFGERLREAGIPVRYSAITRPLKDEPVIRGLFALVELIERRMKPQPATNAQTQSLWFANRLRTLLSSPLIFAINGSTTEHRPIRIQRLESLLDTCCALCAMDSADNAGSADSADSAVMTTNAADSPGDGSQFSTAQHDIAQFSTAQLNESLIADIREHMLEWVGSVNHQAAGAQQLSGITIDDAFHSTSQKASITRQLLLALLVTGTDAEAHTIISVLNAIAAGSGRDADILALEHAIRVIRECEADLASFMKKSAISTVDDVPPDVMLWTAWNACRLAEPWQEASLEPGNPGELANDRLDALMRLFQLSGATRSYANTDDFINQVRGMQIEADSLAHVGPIEHAVTLTTPAGALAQAKRWPIVWMPSLQQGTWPNLTERDTLFGTQELANIVLHGNIDGNWTVPTSDDGFDDDLAEYSTARLIATLNSEKKSFLVSLTRSAEQLKISAVWNTDTIPSDLLFGMLPERFERLSDLAEVPYSQVGMDLLPFTSPDGETRQRQWAGLENSVRGIVTIARSQLANEILHHHADSNDLAGTLADTEAVSSDGKDAMATLCMLASQGYVEANPGTWPFVYLHSSDDLKVKDVPRPEQSGQLDQADRNVEPRQPDQSDRPTVVLTPSAVDTIWQCPLEWVLDSQFTGPMPSNVHMQFGTIIHKVAEIATYEGLDRLALPESSSASPVHEQGLEVLKSHIAERLESIYQELMEGSAEHPNPEDMYLSASKRRLVPRILHNIASYFVDGVQPEYALDGKSPVKVGRFISSEAEHPFNACISVNDVLPVWNRTYPEHHLDEHALFGVMSALSGGFMPSMPESVRIGLTGRIDRIEHRQFEDHETIRIVDYKTGKGHAAKDMFNDLQLICYQLASLFDQQSTGGADQTRYVSQADLFDVAQDGAPALAYMLPETNHQPGLITEGRFNTIFEPRTHHKAINGFIDIEFSEKPSIETVDQELWDFIVRNQHTQGIWALSMISRVFFAASVRLSSTDERMQLDANRCHKPNNSSSGSNTCKAWELLHANVMEERR